MFLWDIQVKSGMVGNYAIAVITAASTVLEKSVRFLEHVSPGCYAGIASILPVSWSA